MSDGEDVVQPGDNVPVPGDGGAAQHDSLPPHSSHTQSQDYQQRVHLSY